mmetsp:Transcript_14553/g.24077  ORF Transcript_14553/g.24077 Transcript_14553/m.24077 type:complete len:110 (-) Transcript_14553:1787-2116(-)
MGDDDGTRRQFEEEIALFWEARGFPIAEFPRFPENGPYVNLHRLYWSVKRLGGFMQCSREKLWECVAEVVVPDRILGDPCDADKWVPFLLQVYSSFLLPYATAHPPPPP